MAPEAPTFDVPIEGRELGSLAVMRVPSQSVQALPLLSGCKARFAVPDPALAEPDLSALSTVHMHTVVPQIWASARPTMIMQGLLRALLALLAQRAGALGQGKMRDTSRQARAKRWGVLGGFTGPPFVP